MKKMMKRFNMEKMKRTLMKRKRNERKKFWLSLLGIGLAGSATMLMSRNNENKIMKRMKQMLNMNMQGLNDLIN
ncbi:hypothetical protein [Fervidibacillus halotolerans]|uniref:Uncharacterized protein n=1 Tax=Fervidibacillus halotolerans TaxID=2980027 RepID=A0A9E8RZG6_9BACI|nr:hypothetical protein [Fervidibacillus halotolerans]WAA13323.1 hypothetical protein OE105_04165 [Fervidibacillus halotolerans]